MPYKIYIEEDQDGDKCMGCNYKSQMTGLLKEHYI